MLTPPQSNALLLVSMGAVKFGPLANRDFWAFVCGILDIFLTHLTLVVLVVDVIVTVDVAVGGVVVVGPDIWKFERPLFYTYTCCHSSFSSSLQVCATNCKIWLSDILVCSDALLSSSCIEKLGIP